MPAPAVIVTLRPGVQFEPAAAASFARADESWLRKTGHRVRCNSTYRDWNTQWGMYVAWNRYKSGDGPYPGHSMAVHPDSSDHCKARAVDTPDWPTPGFLAHMREHGWIQTAPNDKTERHHLVYFPHLDQHRNEPAPAGTGAPIETREWDEMASEQQIRDIVRQEIVRAATANAPEGEGGEIAKGVWFQRPAGQTQSYGTKLNAVHSRDARDVYVVYNLDDTNEATRRAVVTPDEFTIVPLSVAHPLRPALGDPRNVHQDAWDALRSSRTVG